MENWFPSETDTNSGTGKCGCCCTEIDLWEANKVASAYTIDSRTPREQTPCNGVDCGDNGEDRFKGICDKYGCDIQPHRLGTHNFFGPGFDFMIDSTKPVMVTTQLIATDGNDHGKLTEVKQFYQKGGETIQHSSYSVNGQQHNSITDDVRAQPVQRPQNLCRLI